MQSGIGRLYSNILVLLRLVSFQGMAGMFNLPIIWRTQSEAILFHLIHLIVIILEHENQVTAIWKSKMTPSIPSNHDTEREKLFDLP
jgi:hypothetical protein